MRCAFRPHLHGCCFKVGVHVAGCRLRPHGLAVCRPRPHGPLAAIAAPVGGGDTNLQHAERPPPASRAQPTAQSNTTDVPARATNPPPAQSRHSNPPNGGRALVGTEAGSRIRDRDHARKPPTNLKPTHEQWSIPAPRLLLGAVHRSRSPCRRKTLAWVNELACVCRAHCTHLQRCHPSVQGYARVCTSCARCSLITCGAWRGEALWTGGRCERG